MRRSCSAFTMLEILIVVAVISVLAALLFPSLSAAKARSKEVKSHAQLKQLGLATALYRTEHDGDGNYGDIGHMGLPTSYYSVLMGKESAEYISLRQSPCGPHPGDQPVTLNIHYFPGDGTGDFAEQANLYRENLILFYDMNCSAPDRVINNPYQTKKGLGILLSLKLVRHEKLGVHWRPEWWGDPQL